MDIIIIFDFADVHFDHSHHGISDDTSRRRSAGEYEACVLCRVQLHLIGLDIIT